MLCNSIWLWQNSKRQQKPCLSTLACPIKQQASFRWDSLTTTARDKPMPLSTQTGRGPSTRAHTQTQKQNRCVNSCRQDKGLERVKSFALHNLNLEMRNTPCLEWCLVAEMHSQHTTASASPKNNNKKTDNTQSDGHRHTHRPQDLTVAFEV